MDAIFCWFSWNIIAISILIYGENVLICEGWLASLRNLYLKKKTCKTNLFQFVDERCVHVLNAKSTMIMGTIWLLILKWSVVTCDVNRLINVLNKNYRIKSDFEIESKHDIVFSNSIKYCSKWLGRPIFLFLCYEIKIIEPSFICWIKSRSVLK